MQQQMILIEITFTGKETAIEWLKKALHRTNMIVCYYHVTYEFQSESTLYSLSECPGTPCLKQAPYLKFR